MNIQLPTGTTITISAYEYYFLLKEEDMHEFFQSCIADDLGIQINNPFSNKASFGRIEEDFTDEFPEEDIKD